MRPCFFADIHAFYLIGFLGATILLHFQNVHLTDRCWIWMMTFPNLAKSDLGLPNWFWHIYLCEGHLEQAWKLVWAHFELGKSWVWCISDISIFEIFLISGTRWRVVMPDRRTILSWDENKDCQTKGDNSQSQTLIHMDPIFRAACCNLGRKSPDSLWVRQSCRGKVGSRLF